MTATVTTLPVEHTLDFALDATNEAHEPPEARGLRRDDVRLLVSDGDADPVDARFADLGAFLDAGDVLVVNTSATIPAALDGRLPVGEPVVVHLSGELPGGVLARRGASSPRDGTTAPCFVDAPAVVELLGRRARPAARAVRSTRGGCGSRRSSSGWRPSTSRRSTVGRSATGTSPHDWPIDAYQTVFAREPGSAEMPSASRPFSHEVVTDLVGRGVVIAPLLLHTGVSSLEGERAPVPGAVRGAPVDGRRDQRGASRGWPGGRRGHDRRRGARDRHRRPRPVHPGAGWTDVVVTPDRRSPRSTGS